MRLYFVQNLLDFINLNELWLGNFGLIFRLVTKVDGLVVLVLSIIEVGPLTLDDFYKLVAVGVKLIHVQRWLEFTHCFRFEKLCVENKFAERYVLL
jgi:hypothetical protein